MFTTQLISGIILVLLSIVIVRQGDILLYTVTTLISIIGLFELYRALGMWRRSLAAVSYVTTCSCYRLSQFEGQRCVTLMIIVCLMAIMALYVLILPKHKTEEMTGTFSDVCCTSIILSLLYQTRVMNDGAYFVQLIFLSPWDCDTSTHCTDMLLDRHKLTSALSPKKSIEGTVGGAADAALLGLIYASLFRGRMAELDNPRAACTIACTITAVVSQTGDLTASVIKGNHNVKDYDHLIPDHGGILDRFDSIMFTAPAVCSALIFLK